MGVLATPPSWVPINYLNAGKKSVGSPVFEPLA